MEVSPPGYISGVRVFIFKKGAACFPGIIGHSVPDWCLLFLLATPTHLRAKLHEHIYINVSFTLPSNTRILNLIICESICIGELPANWSPKALISNNFNVGVRFTGYTILIFAARNFSE